MKRFGDLRFVLGVVIIVACVAGGAWLFSAVGTNQVVYRYNNDLPVGHQLSESDLVPVEVNLGLMKDTYLNEKPKAGTVLLRPAVAGELVLKSTLGAAADLQLATLVVELGAPIPSGVKVGSDIELWSIPDPTRTGTATEPQKVASGAQVSAIVSDSTILSSKEQKLEVKVKPEDLSGLLKSISDSGILVAVDSNG